MRAGDEACESGAWGLMGNKAPNCVPEVDWGALCRLRGSLAPRSVLSTRFGALFRSAVAVSRGRSIHPRPVDPRASSMRLSRHPTAFEFVALRQIQPARTNGFRALSSGAQMVDERILAERLISYDTSRPDVIVAAAGFVKGWLESRDIEVRHHDHNGLPVLVAEVGPIDAAHPCVVFHGHLDVVPGREEQFEPRLDGDRLIGRGAYDMKGGLAGMMCALKDVERQERVRVRLVVRARRGVRGARRALDGRHRRPGARRGFRDHRRADRTCTSGSRRRACS